jgi:uncharacterized lipoprotein YajG
MAEVDVHQTSGPGDGGVNWILVIAVLVLVLLIAWFFLAGNNDGPNEVNVEVPQAEAPSIDVPDEIDVNVNTPDGQ